MDEKDENTKAVIYVNRNLCETLHKMMVPQVLTFATLMIGKIPLTKIKADC